MKIVFAAFGMSLMVMQAAMAGPVQSFVQSPGPLGALKGTMLAPAVGHGAVVLIIPGSGPTDRDGNNAHGLKAGTYRLLAEGLAARGVTSVRIDKRGMFASAGAVPDANAVTVDDYVRDVHEWVGVIRQRTGAPCVWLLGHSEGGLVALAAARHQDDVCGLILAATPGRRMADVLRQQLQANPANAPLLGQALPAIDALEAGKRVDTGAMNPALIPLFRPAVQGFLISLFSYDPVKLVGGYGKPVLILQGERDIQVRPEDARLLAGADPRAKLVLLPDVNHVFKAVDSESMGANAATYSDPSLPLAPGVVEAIATFLGAAGK